MVASVELKNYTDFDRLLIGRNIIITIIGSVLTFILSYIPETIIKFEDWGLPAFPPFQLSLTIAIILVVTAYTRNIASSVIVAIIGALGIVSPNGNGSVDWFIAYIQILIILAIFIGLLADRLRLVMNWVDFYLTTSLLFSAYFIIWGILTNDQGKQYWPKYELGIGGDLFTDTGIPIIDITILGLLLFLTLLIMGTVQGERILDETHTKKYKVFGYLFFIIGQALSFVSIIIFSDEVSQIDMEAIARNDSHLKTVGDILSHQQTDGYGIIVYPSNIFLIVAVTTVFTAIGLSLLYIGKNKGNIDGMKGGADVVFLAAPLGTFLFLTIGSYYVQNIVSPGGFFISEELASMFTAMIWSVLFFNQWIARFILYILEKLMPHPR